MTILYLFPVCLSLLILAAHFLRYGNMVVVLILLLMPMMLLIRRAWAARTIQGVLILGASEWLRTLFVLTTQRQAEGQPWIRMAIILGTVALITLVAATVFAIPRLRRRYGGLQPPDAG